MGPQHADAAHAGQDRGSRREAYSELKGRSDFQKFVDKVEHNKIEDDKTRTAKYFGYDDLKELATYRQACPKLNH